jgi:hypothetical protein
VIPCDIIADRKPSGSPNNFDRVNRSPSKGTGGVAGEVSEESTIMVDPSSVTQVSSCDSEMEGAAIAKVNDVNNSLMEQRLMIASINTVRGSNRRPNQIR